MDCPCCSGRVYLECCKPYHKGSPAPTPLALMRSRYSAYAMSLANYIINTTHPQSPYFDKDRKKWMKGILEFCQSTRFVKLEIVDYGNDWVHFKAYLKFILEEKSHFEQIAGKWLYVKPINNSSHPDQNQG